MCKARYTFPDHHPCKCIVNASLIHQISTSSVQRLQIWKWICTCKCAKMDVHVQMFSTRNTCCKVHSGWSLTIHQISVQGPRFSTSRSREIEMWCTHTHVQMHPPMSSVKRITNGLSKHQISARHPAVPEIRKSCTHVCTRRCTPILALVKCQTNVSLTTH